MAIITRIHSTLFLCWMLPILSSHAQSNPPGGGYQLAEIRQSAFDEETLGLMNIERGDMAKQLASYVVNELGKKVVSGEADATILAEKFLGLALHLDPRCRVALIADFQLKRGIAPDPVAADYAPDVLAGLLFKRSELLEKQGGQDNVLLARLLLSAAVEMDPHNTDAIYRHELLRRDQGEPDWKRVTSNGK